MGDMAEVFRDMTAAKKERHSKWWMQNMDIMEKSGIEYDTKNSGEVLIIRFTWPQGKPQVEFWPSTGRWRVRGKIFKGGAKSFINWYNKQ